MYFSAVYRLRDNAGRSSTRGRRTRLGWGKRAIFKLNASIFPKRKVIRPKLLVMTNRKLHMCFRLTPTSMTLDDVEQLYVRIFGKFHGDFAHWEATTAKRMKTDQCCQRQRCNPLNVIFNIMFLAFICCRFLQ